MRDGAFSGMMRVPEHDGAVGSVCGLIPNFSAESLHARS